MVARNTTLKADYVIPKYTLAGDSGSTNHEKRLNIVKLLSDKLLAINVIPVDAGVAARVGLSKEVTASAPMKMTGVALARAYYDNTTNTGELLRGRPVVFDTVTGTSVTGINDSWIPTEYRKIGYALEDFSDEPPYEGANNLVLIKIGEDKIPETDIFVLLPPGGIAKRLGLTISSEMCRMFREVAVVGDDTKKTIVKVMDGNEQKEIRVFNIVNSDLDGDKIVATSVTLSGTRYVSVEGCFEEDPGVVAGILND